MNSPHLLSCGIKDVSFGERVTVVQPVNLYGCRIGECSFIGPFVEVQKGASIGARCKVQSHSFICEMVSVGSDCFIGHGVVFINDKFTEGKPAGGDKSKWKFTSIADNVYIGSNATILPVTICSNVVVGAGSVVTRDILKPGAYAGNPARLLKTTGVTE